MRRCLFIACGLVLLLALRVGPVAASGLDEPGSPIGTVRTTRYVCVPHVVWQDHALCPSHGPATTAYRIASISLPDPLPELPARELPEEEDEDLLPHRYAHVNKLPLNIYRHPMEAAQGLPPVRTMLSGDWWVSVEGLVEYEGQRWYRINSEEYVPADTLGFASPSKYQGVYFQVSLSILLPGSTAGWSRRSCRRDQ